MNLQDIMFNPKKQHTTSSLNCKHLEMERDYVLTEIRDREKVWL
jgi:hypothetical protein